MLIEWTYLTYISDIFNLVRGREETCISGFKDREIEHDPRTKEVSIN
jgi:hypothetical protein